MSNSINLSGATMGIRNTHIPSVGAYEDVSYSDPALNIRKEELTYNTLGNKKDHVINNIPVNSGEEKTVTSLTKQVKNSINNSIG